MGVDSLDISVKGMNSGPMDFSGHKDTLPRWNISVVAFSSRYLTFTALVGPPKSCGGTHRDEWWANRDESSRLYPNHLGELKHFNQVTTLLRLLQGLSKTSRWTPLSSRKPPKNPRNPLERNDGSLDKPPSLRTEMNHLGFAFVWASFKKWLPKCLRVH